MQSFLRTVLESLSGTHDIKKAFLPRMPSASAEEFSPSRASTEGGASFLGSPMGAPTKPATPFGTPTPESKKRHRSDDEADASGDDDILPSSPKRLFKEPEASETGSEADDEEYDEDDPSGSEYDASETGSEYDRSETGSEYDPSETGDEDHRSCTALVPSVPIRVGNPADDLPEALLRVWKELFSPDICADLRALFGEGADYLLEYVSRFTEHHFYNGHVWFLERALCDAKQFLATIDIMVRRIRGDGIQTKITFHFRPMNKTHCRNLLALRRVAMDILTHLTTLEARRRAVEQALQLEEQARQLRLQAAQLEEQARQLRR